MAKFIAAILLSSCTSSLPEPATSRQPADGFEEVAFGPPPARVELVPPSPSPEAVWLDGEWDWTGTRWAWQYGRWVVPPASATYAKWEIVRGADGRLRFARGAWRTRNGAEVSAPAALAVARAHDEGVVNVEGHTERTAPNESPRAVNPNAR